MKLEYVADHEPFYKKYSSDAGLDICSPRSFIVGSKKSYFLRTGIRIKPPKVPFFLRPWITYGILVVARSGLSVKSNLEVGAGLIDYHYRGEFGIQLYNWSQSPLFFEKGSRVAQLMFIPVLKINKFKKVTEFKETDRGEKGIGSTGI